MLKVGITGGIGSGKSTISKAFKALGIKVYNCDIEAKRLNETNPVIISGLKELVGKDVYLPDGHLDKRLMAQRIFADKDLLGKVNNLIHPEVAKDFELWAQRQEAAGARWVLCEAAVLIESNLRAAMDKLIVVSLPMEERIKRTMARDNATREQVEGRMRAQLSDSEMIEAADYVIVPDDHHLLTNQIIDILTELNTTE